jgi:hypothetical protein
MQNRTAKAFAPILAASILFYSPAAFALTGGPFDNGYQTGATAAGTYAGVITGKNLIGLVQFGISDTAEDAGRFAVFHEGINSYGFMDGIVDPAAQRVAGVLLGVAALPGEDTGGSGSPGTPFQTITVRTSAEGAFTAEMQGFPVAITFEGKGELSTVANPITQTEDADGGTIIVTTGGQANDGETDPGNGDDGTNTQQASGSANVTILGTLSRETTEFEIRGSRTSIQSYVPFSDIASVPPLTPGGASATPLPGVGVTP